jgi:3-hydroxymyristoyl/3-hydroxydecanoyl-(acyl carrier protein) dehydratase
MSAIPFLGHRDRSAVLAWRGERPVHVSDFLRDLAAVAAALPERRFLVNLCADRYRFAVGLAAALLREQVSLLPPAHTPELLRLLKARYPGLYALCDGGVQTDALEAVGYPTSAAGVPTADMPAFPASLDAIIAFTSGSTGEPTPHPKSWGRLALGAVHEAQSLELGSARGVALVGTVPPQHMYGLESTVLLALRNGLAFHATRPFYPADIHMALAQIPKQRVLVTTPVHLRALLAEESSLPRLRFILCATAPLPVEMAAEAEARYSAPVHEIFGFTEAGMVATRRTTHGPRWYTLPGVRLWRDRASIWVGGGHVQADVAFADLVEMEDEHTFVLQGRSSDLVNIAGKRSSLAYLDQQLLAIEGVQDGVFFLPDEPQGGIVRLTAFVVAPQLSREALMSALRSRIDPAFLPRPLYYVEALPRAATGKLAREALIQLARAAQQARSGRVTQAILRLPAEHPSVEGHFPGNPIVPGALLLDEILAAIERARRQPPLAWAVKSVKFLQPVRPGDELVIEFAAAPSGDIRFRCRIGALEVVTGLVRA